MTLKSDIHVLVGDTGLGKSGNPIYVVYAPFIMRISDMICPITQPASSTVSMVRMSRATWV